MQFLDIFKKQNLDRLNSHGNLIRRLFMYATVIISLFISLTLNFDQAYKHSPGAQKIASESLLNGEMSLLPNSYKHGIVVQRNVFVIPKLMLPNLEYEKFRKIWMFVLIFISSLIISEIALNYYGGIGGILAIVPTVTYVLFENFNALFFSNLYWLGFLPALSLIILFYANTLKKIFWLSFVTGALWFLRGYEYATWFGLLLVTPFIFKLAKKEMLLSVFFRHCFAAFLGFLMAFLVVLSMHGVLLYGEVENFQETFMNMISKRVIGAETNISCFNVSVGSDFRRWLTKDDGLYFGNLMHYLVSIILLLTVYRLYRSKLRKDASQLVFALVSCGLWGLVASVSWYFAAFYHSSCHHHLNDILYLFPSGIFFTSAVFVLAIELGLTKLVGNKWP